MAEIELREATERDAMGVARVSVDTWRSAYQGLLPGEVLDRLSYEQREENYRRTLLEPDHPFAFVAIDRGRVVGYAMGGPERTRDPIYSGELYAIYIMERYQGRGIGRRMVRLAANRLTEQNRHSLLVWVLANNPARGFYEGLGGKVLRGRPLDLSGTVVEEVAYGWADTIKLRAR